MGARVSRRSSVEHSKRENGRKRAWYARHGAGRTFVQDGFDARTGDEREPGSNPENRERRHPPLRATERIGQAGAGAREPGSGTAGRKREKEEGETAQA